MYNEIAKNRFINHLYADDEKRASNFRSTFETLAPFEDLYQKDICNFNTTEIDNAYKTINQKSLTALRNINSMLLLYTQWCQKEAMVEDGINHYEEFYGDRMYSYLDREYINNGLISKEMLLDIAQDMYNKMDAFALIATFEGFGGVGREDYSYATLSHIEGNKIHLNKRTIEISDDFIKYAKMSAKQDSYYARAGEKFDKNLDESSDLIYRPLLQRAGQNPRLRIVEQRLAKELKALGYNSLSLSDVVKSGRALFIKTKATSLGITPKQYCLSYRSEIANQFCTTEDYVAIIYQELRMFLE